MSTTIIREIVRPDSYGTPRTFVEFKCDRCGEPHSRPKRNFKTENFCSITCSQLHRHPNGRKEIECAFCKNLFEIKTSQLSKSQSGLHFCSRVCKDTAQRIESGFTEIQPSHYGTHSLNYREIAFKNFPHKCVACDYDKYPEILEVHHKDGDRTNNNVKNLEFRCPNCHDEHHFLTKTGKYSPKK